MCLLEKGLGRPVPGVAADRLVQLPVQNLRPRPILRRHWPPARICRLLLLMGARIEAHGGVNRSVLSLWQPGIRIGPYGEALDEQGVQGHSLTTWEEVPCSGPLRRDAPTLLCHRTNSGCTRARSLSPSRRSVC